MQGDCRRGLRASTDCGLRSTERSGAPGFPRDLNSHILKSLTTSMDMYRPSILQILNRAIVTSFQTKSLNPKPLELL